MKTCTPVMIVALLSLAVTACSLTINPRTVSTSSTPTVSSASTSSTGAASSFPADWSGKWRLSYSQSGTQIDPCTNDQYVRMDEFSATGELTESLVVYYAGIYGVHSYGYLTSFQTNILTGFWLTNESLGTLKLHYSNVYQSQYQVLHMDSNSNGWVPYVSNLFVTNLAADLEVVYYYRFSNDQLLLNMTNYPEGYRLEYVRVTQ